MKTVKEVAALTGISVRTLQYYDEIGVFKPTSLTEAGYRLYDEEALKTLQQILLFRELDFPLKEIKRIMTQKEYDQAEAFQKQKALLIKRRDRLDRLLSLLDKLEKGESCMEFEDFKLQSYLQLLELSIPRKSCSSGAALPPLMTLSPIYASMKRISQKPQLNTMEALRRILMP